MRLHLLVKIALVCLATPSAWGQGYFNAFNGFRPGGVGTPFAFIQDGLGVPVAGGRVEIFTADGLTLLASGVTGTGGLAGIFSLGVITIPNAPGGGPAGVLIQAWDPSPPFVGASDREQVWIWWNSISAPPSPPSTMAQSNFTGITFNIPEPSVVALASIGLVGWLVVSRRRNGGSSRE